MKKITLIILGLAVNILSTNAFSQGAPSPIFGAKAGLNFTNIGGDETDNKMKTALHMGIYSEVFFNYFLMMQAELLISQQGHASDNGSSLNLWYINLPLMARYNLGYNLNVHAGLQLGFLLSAKSKFQDQKIDQKEFFKGIDFGIPIGVGYEFWDRKLNATARYIIPVNNISKDDAFKRTNSVIQLSVGILIFRIDA